MARDRTRSVHRIPALAICLPALGLPIVQISHRRGSLIPIPLSERREADHTIQQAVDRTIYTPHISFHRLHKPYLLHAPSVEPWTADKHRPCQSPTGQRDVMIAQTPSAVVRVAGIFLEKLICKKQSRRFDPPRLIFSNSSYTNCQKLFSLSFVMMHFTSSWIKPLLYQPSPSLLQVQLNPTSVPLDMDFTLSFTFTPKPVTYIPASG